MKLLKFSTAQTLTLDELRYEPVQDIPNVKPQPGLLTLVALWAHTLTEPEVHGVADPSAPDACEAAVEPFLEP